MRELEQAFMNAVDQNHLAHAYLFEGMNGTGKKELAYYIAQLLFCERRKKGQVPCGTCSSCQRVMAQNIVDFIEIYPQGQSIKVDQIRELKQELSHRGFEYPVQLCLIYEADKMTTSASNSLLKVLEEPESSLVFLLMTENKIKILPTILSRCQIIHLKELPKEEFSQRLIAAGISTSLARFLSFMTSSFEEAVRLSQDESFLQLKKESWQWFQLLQRDAKQAFVGVQTSIMPLLTESAKIEIFIECLLFYYRDMLFVLTNQSQKLVQKEKQAEYEKFIDQLQTESIIKRIEQLYHVLGMLRVNVGTQSALEKWVIQYH